jgi:hypothetical protein
MMDFINDISGTEVMLFGVLMGLYLIWLELWTTRRQIQKNSKPNYYEVLDKSFQKLDFINGNLNKLGDVDKKLDKVLYWMEDNSREVGLIQHQTREINESLKEMKQTRLSD